MLRRDREWLEASIQQCERIQQIVSKRLELLRGLRAELDVDLADLLRELDGTSTVETRSKVEAQDQTRRPIEEETKIVDAKIEPLTREVVSGSEAANKKVDASREPQGERQIRGDQNPNRLLILKLTRDQPMTVPSLERELSARIGKISKQSVDNWVKKLLSEDLLVREESPDPASKFQYRRSVVPDSAEEAEESQLGFFGEDSQRYST